MEDSLLWKRGSGQLGVKDEDCAPMVGPLSQRKLCSAMWCTGWTCRPPPGHVNLEVTSPATYGADNSHH